MTTTIKDLFLQNSFFSDFALELIKGDSIGNRRELSSYNEAYDDSVEGMSLDPEGSELLELVENQKVIALEGKAREDGELVA